MSHSAFEDMPECKWEVIFNVVGQVCPSRKTKVLARQLADAKSGTEQRSVTFAAPPSSTAAPTPTVSSSSSATSHDPDEEEDPSQPFGGAPSVQCVPTIVPPPPPGPPPRRTAAPTQAFSLVSSVTIVDLEEDEDVDRAAFVSCEIPPAEVFGLLD